MLEGLTINCNSWHQNLQTVTDLIEANRLLSPAAAIRVTRLAPSRKAHNGTTADTQDLPFASANGTDRTIEYLNSVG